MEKKLKLSKENSLLTGVCAGIAEYLNVDVTLVRIITVGLAIIFQIVPVIIAYIICWAVIPLGDKK